MKEIFENIKNDKEFKYLYFDSEQKKFVENILNKSSFKVLFGLYFKTFRILIINSYDYNGVYRITKIFRFIKIIAKLTKLQINLLNERLNHLEILL